MKSGLEGRNNQLRHLGLDVLGHVVSMKSGLEGRNNSLHGPTVEPNQKVSMKSGLEGRNNSSPRISLTSGAASQ